jgi:hypothetical protein
VTVRRFHDCLSVVAVAGAAFCVACGGDGTEPVHARTLQIAAGDTQTSRPGEELPIPLRVRVTGSDDRAFAGATVQWTVTVGSATVNPTQSTSNSSGEAETRVTMGPSVGAVVVRASVQGIEPITFASVALPPCEWFAWPDIPLGSTITGTLRPLDCESDDRFRDLYPFIVGPGQAIEVRLRSTSFDPELQFYSQAPWYYWVNDSTNATREVRFKAIVPPDDDRPGSDYGVAVTSMEPRATGGYELRVASVSQSVESCEVVLVMLGITTAQSLAATDCREPSGQNADYLEVVVLLGQRIRITQSSTQFAPLLRLVRAGRVVAEAGGSSTEAAVLVYTGEADDLYEIHASSTTPQQTGSYTLAVGLDIAADPQISKALSHGLLKFHPADHARRDPRAKWARLGASPRP